MLTAMLLFIFCLIQITLPPALTALQWEDIGTLKFLINLISHMFAHGNWGHLLGNFIFGFPYMLYLEYKVGWRRALGCFFVGGLAAALFSWANQLIIPSIGGIGSSGAVFAMVACTLMLADEHRTLAWLCRALLAFFAFEQLVQAMFDDATLGFSGVGHWAHVGGIVAGVLLAGYHKLELARSQRPDCACQLKECDSPQPRKPE